MPERVKAVWDYAFKQEKMDYYQPAGIAHKAIFIGFCILTMRTLVLWGRGVDPGFNLFVLGPTQPLGKVYEFAKDLVALMVLFGALTFVYFRVVRPQKRMTLHWEGLLILGIISTMMIADMAYDGAALTPTMLVGTGEKSRYFPRTAPTGLGRSSRCRSSCWRAIASRDNPPAYVLLCE